MTDPQQNLVRTYISNGLTKVPAFRILNYPSSKTTASAVRERTPVPGECSGETLTDHPR